MTQVDRTRRSLLEKKGWTRQFTVEEHRVSEYVEVYESLGHEICVEPVVPSEMEEGHICYATECNKYRTISRAQSNTKQKRGDLEE